MNGEQRPGDHLVICDRSGFKVWASETIVEWNGLRVARRFADLSRHPQDSVKGVKDDPSVPNPRPEAADSFIVTPITAADL